MRDGPDKPPIILKSKEGVAQGCVLGMIIYGTGLMPLCEQMREEVPEVLQPWYADDAATAGPARANARCLRFLMEKGPVYGYHPEPEKGFYICKEEDEPVARRDFEREGFYNINFVRGRRYLGGFLGSREARDGWIKSKVEEWASAIGVLAKVARKYPQSAYAGYTFCLQNEWTYLARVTPDCASLFGPLERAIREELLPAFLCIGASDITNDFRALLSLSVSLGGFGMRNPVLAAEEMHDTSVDACQLLTNSLVEVLHWISRRMVATWFKPWYVPRRSEHFGRRGFSASQLRRPRSGVGGRTLPRAVG